jgi:hypothetical protein
MDRSADGVPHQMDRTKALGNSIVPAISEWLGRQILASELVADRPQKTEAQDLFHTVETPVGASDES